MILTSMHSSSTLSIRTVECLFLWFTSILSFFTIWTLFSQIQEISFNTYSYLGGIVSIIITGIVGVISKKYVKNAASHDVRTLIVIVGIAIITAGTTLFAHRYDGDDYYYVPNAIYHLEHPQEPLNFEVHSLALEQPDQKIISYTWGTSLAFEYMQAAFAYILKQNYLFFYHIIMPAIIGFLIPLGLFYLFSYFTEQTEDAAIAAFITTGMILLLGETHRTFGNCFLTRIFQGKIVCLTVGLYLFISLTLRYFTQPNLFYWTGIFTLVTGMLGLTTSTFVLFPPLAIILILALIASKQIKISMFLSALYFGVFIYLLWYFLFLIKYSIPITNLGLNSPVNYGWPTTFGGHALFFYNSQKPITVIVVASATALGVLLSKKVVRIFLSTWIILIGFLYLNPIVAPFFIRYITTPNIYWRMFYLYPFPLLLGISIMELFNKLTIKWRFKGMILTLILICILNVYSDSSAFHYGVQFDSPHYKLPDKEYHIAKEVIEFAPQGIMLAPSDIGGIVAMLSSAYPQVRIREDGERLWLGNEQADVRIQASHFVQTGDWECFHSFKTLLEHPILRLQSIIMNIEVFNQREVKDVIAHYNFNSYRIISNYIVLWSSEDNSNGTEGGEHAL